MTIFAARLRSFFSEVKFANALQTYFRSGWAFLIPYLAAYLLYAWLGWPVNGQGAGSAEPGALASGLPLGATDAQSSALSAQLSSPPSLLHFYWFLHALHLVVGALALSAWFRERRKLSALTSHLSTLNPQPSTLNPQLSALTSQRSTLWPLLPWLLLAALFYLPGFYLEWPSDPWEHLRRINEWHAHDTVTAHTSWQKSSYFLPYSLTGFTSGHTQLSLLNLYYTAVCVLLSWQYYRLGRAVGLSQQAAFGFVLLTALFLGNNIFSFYRYYGLSSSILAQLGAVALTRIALEALRPQGRDRGTGEPCAPRAARGGRQRGDDNGEGSREQKADDGTTGRRSDQSVVRGPSSVGRSLLLRGPMVRGLLLLAPCALLLALTACNHPQGLGIAGLGLLAVMVWRLIEWKRAMIGWLALAALLASVAVVLWWPRHPAIDEIYRPQGWLTAWYGFNLFALESPTFARAYEILGAFGGLNLALGLWLVIRRNHLAGWLTLMPVLALTLPCFALPFAQVLAAKTHAANIITFHRFLFAVPMGLALVAWAQCAYARTTGLQAHGTARQTTCRLWGGIRYSVIHRLRSVVPVAGLAGAVLLSPGSSAYNRLWHSVQITPDDLALRSYTAAWTPANRTVATQENTLTITSPLGAKIQEIFAPNLDWRRRRQFNTPLAPAEIEPRRDWLSALTPTDWRLTDAGARQNWQRFVRHSAPAPTRLAMDFTADDTPWLRLGGRAAEATFRDGRLILSNPLGATSHVFNPELIPIEQTQRYRLTSTLRQTGDPAATNYLAVVWYDRAGHLLTSHVPAPGGAGTPIGWSNGTYSYYGLVNRPAPAEWTAYTVSFGLGEAAAIPAHAAFIRVGALLNHRATPDTVVELTGVRLQEIPPHDTLLLALPDPSHLTTPGSQAARLSGHWWSDKVPQDQAGSREILSAAPPLPPVKTD